MKILFLILAILLSIKVLAVDGKISYRGIFFEDNLYEVTKKIMLMDVESIYIEDGLKKTNLPHVDKIVDLKKIINNYFQSKKSGAKIEKYEIYEGDRKKTVEVISFPIKVIAKYINYKGIPFQLEVSFQPNPGLLYEKPENIIPLDKDVVSCHVIDNILVKCQSPLLKDKVNEINEIFKERFGPLYDAELAKNGGKKTKLNSQDKAANGDEINAKFDLDSSSGPLFSLEYRSMGYLEILNTALKSQAKRSERDASPK